MHRIAFAAAMTLLAAPPYAAAAEPMSCSTRADLLDHLSVNYKEVPAAVGLADNGELLEVFVSIDGGTWTVAFTRPDGLSCMIATGQHWQDLPRIAESDDPA
jgi:hypothetical protein